MRWRFLILSALVGCSPTDGTLVPPSIVEPDTPTPTPRPRLPDDDPVFEPPPGTFDTLFEVVVESDPPGADILYTEDGSLPSDASALIDGPLSMLDSTRVTAVLDAEVTPGPDGEPRDPEIATATYFRLDSSMSAVTSTVPMLLIHTFETGELRRDVYEFEPARMMVMEPDEDGLSRMLGDATIDAPVGIKIRGSSTRNQEKQSWRFEFHDVFGEDDGYELGGMASEADWILFAPLRFDQAYLRNPLAYEISRQMGRWAPRTRQVEVWLIDNHDTRFRTTDYEGVYTLVERIEPDENRLVIDKLTPEDNALPELSGGYVFKVDRTAPGDGGFEAGGSDRLNMVFPDPAEITPAQQAYLTDYIDQFAAALYAPDFRNPTTGLHYSEYIDVDAWIDHHIVNVFTRNPDGLRLSSYFHKPRDGKLLAGPVWDFDRTMGSTDGRDESPEGYQQGNGNGFFTFIWWGGLFEDPAFEEAYWARWREVLDGPLSPASLNATIDMLVDEIDDGPAQRNHDRWANYQHPGGWEAAVEHLRWWVTTRSAWIDADLRAREAARGAPTPPPSAP